MNRIDQSIYSMNKSFNDFTKSKRTPYYAVNGTVHTYETTGGLRSKNPNHMSIKKKVAITSAITGTSLILGSLLATVFLKGKYNNAFKLAEGFLEKIEENLLEATLKDKKVGEIRAFSLDVAEAVKKGFHTLEGLANGSLLKDRLSDRFFLNPKVNKALFEIPKQYAEWARKTFKNICKTTTVKEWEKCAQKHNEAAELLELCAQFLQEKAESLTCSPELARERADDIEKIAKEIKTQVAEHAKAFLKGEKPRYEQMEAELGSFAQDLDKRYSSIFKDPFLSSREKALTLLKMHGEYIPDAMITEKRAAYFETLHNFRNRLTHSLDSIYDQVFPRLDDSKLPQGCGIEIDREFIKAKLYLRNFCKVKTDDVQRLQNKDKCVEQIDRIIQLLGNKANSEEYRQVIANLQEAREIVHANKKGLVEEARDLFKFTVDETKYNVIYNEKDKYPNFYNRFKTLVEEADAAHNTAIKSEMKLYEKIRDMNLGVAGIDLLEWILPIVGMGYGIARTKDKEKRTSITLKAGIPATAAIGVGIIAQFKQVAGSKALVLGATAGFILNRIGSYIDEQYKALIAERKAQNPVLYGKKGFISS